MNKRKSPPANPFFSIEDFLSLEVNIEGSNLTSQVSILKGGIQLAQFLENGMVIEVPPRSCSTGHLLSLQIEVKRPVGDQLVTASTTVTGIVVDLDGDPKTRQMASLAFRQYSRETWESFLEYLSTKQAKANDLIRKIHR